MNSELVKKFFEHMSNGDIDSALSFLHEDHVSHDMGTGMVMTGLQRTEQIWKTGPIHFQT